MCIKTRLVTDYSSQLWNISSRSCCDDNSSERDPLFFIHSFIHFLLSRTNERRSDRSIERSFCNALVCALLSLVIKFVLFSRWMIVQGNLSTHWSSTRHSFVYAFLLFDTLFICVHVQLLDVWRYFFKCNVIWQNATPNNFHIRQNSLTMLFRRLFKRQRTRSSTELIKREKNSFSLGIFPQTN